MRRLFALAAAVVALAAVGGCGNVYNGSGDGDPALAELRCEPQRDPRGMLVLLAQAVPTATVVPCLRADPGRWVMSEFTVRDGSAVLKFAYQYGGPDNVTVEIRPSCDVGAAREVSSQYPGTQRYNRTLVRNGRYANEIYFTYEDACTWVRFDLEATGAELRGAEFTGTLGFVTRAELDRQIRAATDGRLRLDPER